MRNAIVGMLLLVALAGCAHPEAANQQYDNSALVAAGHRVALLKCARCHAIEPSGESRNPNAPPFREVSRSITIMSSEASITEGIRIGHMDMPPVRLTRPEIDAISAYLHSLRS